MNENVWFLEEYQAVHRAFNERNVSKFRHLLCVNPQYLYSDSGRHPWMEAAAMENLPEFMEVLLSLRIDINATKRQTSDEFYEPEGAIVQAVGQGHLEMVRWMLERGAQINVEFCGQRRCMPLVYASTNGDLAMVKLLVENGADVSAVWRGNDKDKIPLNAITQAAVYGHQDVVDYLYALGARDVRETEPRDPLSHQRIRHEMKERGLLAKWRLPLGTSQEVTLHLRPANEQFPLHTIFTIGLSDARLPTASDPYAANELQLLLPPDWPITPETLAEMEWGWPIFWITKIVHEHSFLTDWRSWLTTTFADGTKFGEGNPICNLMSLSIHKGIRVIQEAASSNDMVITAFTETFGHDPSEDGYVIELVIVCELSKESADIAKRLVTEWVRTKEVDKNFGAVITSILRPKNDRG